MGNVFSASSEIGPELENSCDWDFIGRQRELKELQDCLLTFQVVEIHGMMQIGQSRLMKAWFKKEQGQIRKDKSSTLLLYFDFQTCFKGKSLSTCVESASKAFQSNFENNTDSDDFAKAFTDVVNSFRNNSLIVFFLDNLHFLNKTELARFQSFMKNVTKETGLKFVLSTNEKIMSTSKVFVSYELGVLTDDDILELLHTITENKYREDDEERVYMRTVAKLCEGLPLAAMVAGTDLKENDFFLSPSEMVEILFTNRFKALSPDVYPEEEKLSVYNRTIDKAENLGPYFAEFIKRMEENTTGNTLDTKDILQAVGSKHETMATTKKYLIQLNQKGVILNLRKNTVHLHGVIREATQGNILLATVEDLPQVEKNKYEETVLKDMRENFEKVGIKDVSDEVLRNPKQLEELIKKMAFQNCHLDEDETSKESSLYTSRDENIESCIAVCSNGSSFELVVDDSDVHSPVQESGEGDSLAGPHAFQYIPFE